MAAAAPASSDPQEGQAMARAKAEAAEASIRSLVPVKVKYILRAFLGSIDVTKGANLLIIVKSSIQTCPGKGVLTKNCKIYKLLLRN